MSFWTKMEKWSEKNIEGLFRQKSGGSVQPAEIAKMIAREMRDMKTVGVSKIYIPNEYTVLLGPEDYSQMSSFAGTLSRELQDFVTAKAKQRKYIMVGPPRIKFLESEGLPLGNVEVKGRFTEEVPVNRETPKAGTPVTGNTINLEKEKVLAALSQDAAAQFTDKTMVRGEFQVLASLKVCSEFSSRSFPLGTKPAVIGRRRSSDIPLLDENVSRSHAEISYIEGAHRITDLGSTNGVFVNGQRVLKSELNNGDKIKMGKTVLEYRVV